jgi:RNA polymerase sigma-70 factor (ECF subfamily)
MDGLERLERFRLHGDHGEFDHLVRLYAPLVYGVCRRRLNNHADAEDAVQEVFLALLRNADRVTTHLGAWLHRTACNVAVSHVRGRASQRRTESVYVQLARPACDCNDVDLLRLVDECLAQMPEQECELILETQVRRIPQRVIAERRGVSQQAVAKQLARSLDRLRGAVRERGVAVSGAALVAALLGSSSTTAVSAVAIVSTSAVSQAIVTSTPWLSTAASLKLAGTVAIGVALLTLPARSPIETRRQEAPIARVAEASPAIVAQLPSPAIEQAPPSPIEAAAASLPSPKQATSSRRSTVRNESLPPANAPASVPRTVARTQPQPTGGGSVPNQLPMSNRRAGPPVFEPLARPQTRQVVVESPPAASSGRTTPERREVLADRSPRPRGAAIDPPANRPSSVAVAPSAPKDDSPATPTDPTSPPDQDGPIAPTPPKQVVDVKPDANGAVTGTFDRPPIEPWRPIHAPPWQDPKGVVSVTTGVQGKPHPNGFVHGVGDSGHNPILISATGSAWTPAPHDSYVGQGLSKVGHHAVNDSLSFDPRVLNSPDTGFIPPLDARPAAGTVAILGIYGDDSWSPGPPALTVGMNWMPPDGTLASPGYASAPIVAIAALGDSSSIGLAVMREDPGRVIAPPPFSFGAAQQDVADFGMMPQMYRAVGHEQLALALSAEATLVPEPAAWQLGLAAVAIAAIFFALRSRVI